MHKMQKGFTLIELSIVLVIIAFLLIAILAAEDLMQQSKIGTAISRISSYNTSASAFKSKYGGMPGDLANAYSLGLDKDVSGTQNVAATEITNYDGDGDGLLNLYWNSTKSTAQLHNWSGEIANFWVHLSNSGMIKEKFSQPYGCMPNSNCLSDYGNNYPKMEVTKAIIALTDFNDKKLYFVYGASYKLKPYGNSGGATPLAEWLTVTKGDSIYVASVSGDTGRYFSEVADALKPQEAFSIDAKIDDALPDTGNVQVIGGYQYDLNVFGAFLPDPNPGNSISCYSSSGGDYKIKVNKPLCTIKVLAPL